MHASNVLEPDREQLDRFIKTLFRHAYKNGRVSIRAFVVNKGGKQTAVILDDARLGDRLVGTVSLRVDGTISHHDPKRADI